MQGLFLQRTRIVDRWGVLRRLLYPERRHVTPNLLNNVDYDTTNP